eukprot:ANDGO_06475.mRNA.1 GTPase-activating protein GYP2
MVKITVELRFWFDVQPERKCGCKRSFSAPGMNEEVEYLQISARQLIQMLESDSVPKIALASLEILDSKTFEPQVMLHPFVEENLKRKIQLPADNILFLKLNLLPGVHIEHIRLRMSKATSIFAAEAFDSHSRTSVRIEQEGGLLYKAGTTESDVAILQVFSGITEINEEDFVYVGEQVSPHEALSTYQVVETPDSRSWVVHLEDPKAKALLRKGIPDIHRRDTWLKILGIDRSAHALEEEYKNSFRHTFHIDFEPTYIPLHVPSFGAERLMFEQHSLTKAGTNAARRLLCVFAENHPRIVFCPCLPDLVSLFLLFMTEAEAYACICYVTKRSEENNWYFRLGREARLISLLTLQAVLQKVVPSVAEKMKALGLDAVDAFSPWFDRLFYTYLPLAANLRFLDSFLLEGAKILYRFGAALLSMHTEEFAKAKSVDDFKNVITNCGFKTDPEDLIRRAFKMQLSREDLMQFDNGNRERLDPTLLRDAQRIKGFVAPKFPTRSRILHRRLFEFVWHWLSDDRLRLKAPQRVFATEDDGYSILTFINKCEAIGPHILVVQDFAGHIFGAVLSDGWHPSSGFYGSGVHSFLFSFSPSVRNQSMRKRPLSIRSGSFANVLSGSAEALPASSHFDDPEELSRLEKSARVFRWQTGESGNSYVQLVRPEGLVIGAGGEGFGLSIDSRFESGTTAPCDTFGNDALCSCNDGVFQIAQLEVFSLL